MAEEVTQAAQEHLNQLTQSRPNSASDGDSSSRKRNGAPNTGDFRSSLHVATDRLSLLVGAGDGVVYGSIPNSSRDRTRPDAFNKDEALRETQEWIEGQIPIIAESHIAKMVAELNGGTS